jgi:hypothetical protein
MAGAEAELIVKFGTVTASRKEVQGLRADWQQLAKTDTTVAVKGVKDTAQGFKEVGKSAEEATTKAHTGLKNIGSAAWYVDHSIKNLGRSFMHIAGPIGALHLITEGIGAARAASAENQKNVFAVGGARRESATHSRMSSAERTALRERYAGFLDPVEMEKVFSENEHAGAKQVERIIRSKIVDPKSEGPLSDKQIARKGHALAGEYNRDPAVREAVDKARIEALQKEKSVEAAALPMWCPPMSDAEKKHAKRLDEINMEIFRIRHPWMGGGADAEERNTLPEGLPAMPAPVSALSRSDRPVKVEVVSHLAAPTAPQSY